MKILYLGLALVFLFVAQMPAASYAEEDVVWQNAVGVSVSSTSNRLTNTASSSLWGYSGASSVQIIPSGDGYFEVRVTETLTSYMMGLTNGDPDQHYLSGDFFMHLRTSGNLVIYENGVNRETFERLRTGDVMKVAVESGVVKYYRNDILLYTSTQSPVYPLVADVALSISGSTVVNARIHSVDALTPPIITLTGENPQTIKLGAGYTELGATTDDGSLVVVNSSAFSDSIGSYTILYNSVDSFGNVAIPVTRTVIVQDMTPPTITAPPHIALESMDEQTIVDIGIATAYDDDANFDPIITNDAPDSFPVGTTIVTWTATDSSGNISTATQKILIFELSNETDDGLLYGSARVDFNGTADSIVFVASKQQDTFALFCQHFTSSSTEEWNNQTGTNLYSAAFFSKQTSYVRCYDESHNIILLETIYKPYDIKSGLNMINDTFGDDGLFGVPFPFLIILIVASIWTGRNAQVGVIVTGATIGIMGLLGLFELSAEVWAMIVLLIAVGMFLGKKVF